MGANLVTTGFAFDSQGNYAAELRQEASGIEPLMVQPWPRRESQRTVPPMAPSRSAMLT